MWSLHKGDEFRFSVYEKGNASNVVMQKTFSYGSNDDVTGDEGEIISTTLTLEFDPKETAFGEVISKPVDYWYEVEHIMHHGMSTDEEEYEAKTDVTTLIGYDEDGAKILKLFPEANYEL